MERTGVMVRVVIAVGVLTLSVCVPSSVGAQAPPVLAAADAVQDAAAPSERGGAAQFIRDVGGDYKHFFSWSTAKWLGVGTIATAAIHPADDEIRDATQGEQVGILSETAGQTYG